MHDTILIILLACLHQTTDRFASTKPYGHCPHYGSMCYQSIQPSYACYPCLLRVFVAARSTSMRPGPGMATEMLLGFSTV